MNTNLIKNLHPSSAVLTNDSWFLYLLDRRHETFGVYFKLGQTGTSANELDADGNRAVGKRSWVQDLINVGTSVEDKSVLEVVKKLRQYGPSDHVKAAVHFSRRQMQAVCRSLGFENLDDMFRTLLNSHGFLSNRGGHDREELINATNENLEQVLDLIVKLYCELTAAKTAGKPDFKLRFLQAELWTAGMSKFAEHGRLLIQAAGGFGKSTMSLRFACSDFVMSRPGVTLVLTPVKATGNDFKANAKFFQYFGREAVVVLLADLNEAKFNELLAKTKADGNMLVVIATVQDARGKIKEKLKDEDGESKEDAEAVVKELLKLETKYSFLLGNIRLLIRDEIHLQYAAELTYSTLSRLKPELTIDMTATLTAREAIMYSYNADTIASCSLIRVLEAKRAGVPDLQRLPEMELIAASNMSAPKEFLREFDVATEAELTSAKMFSVFNNTFMYKNGLLMLLERTFSLGKFSMMSGAKGLWGPSLCGTEGQTDVYMLVIPRGDSSFAASQKCTLLCEIGNESYSDQAFFITAEELEHDAELNKRSLELSMEAIRRSNPGRKIIVVTHRKLLTGINIPQLEGIALWDSIESQSLFLQLWYRLFRAHDDKKIARMVVYEPGVGIADKSNSVALGLGALLIDELDGLDDEAKKRRIAELEGLINFSMYADAKPQKLSTANLYAAYEMSFAAQMAAQFGGTVRSDAINTMLGDSYAELLALIEPIAKGKASKGTKAAITDENGGKTKKPGSKTPEDEGDDSTMEEKPGLALDTLKAMLQELPWVAHETQTFDLMSLLDHEMMSLFYGEQNAAALRHMVLDSRSMFEFLTNRLKYTRVDMSRSVTLGLGTRAVVLDGQLILDMLNKLPSKADRVLLVNPKRLLLEEALKKYAGSKIVVLTYDEDPYLGLYKREGLTVISVEKNLLCGTIEDMKLKFNVIVGNPPYQDAGNRALNVKLWHKFSWMALKSLTADGWIAFVTPGSAFNSHGEGGKILKYITTTLKLEAAALNERSTFDAGIDTCYWIASRQARGIQPPITVDDLAESIIAKMLDPKNPRLKLHAHMQPVTRADLSDSGSIILFSGSKISFTKVPVSTDEELKLVFPFSSSYHNQFVTRHPLGMFNMYFKLEDEAQADRIRSFTLSKLYKFFASKYQKTSGFTPAVKNSMLPAVDMSRTWSDKELYEHFGLTTEEIALVEAV